jgi:hypothetical protein
MVEPSPNWDDYDPISSHYLGLILLDQQLVPSQPPKENSSLVVIVSNTLFFKEMKLPSCRSAFSHCTTNFGDSLAG